MKCILCCVLYAALLRNACGQINPGATLWAPAPSSLQAPTNPTLPVPPVPPAPVALPSLPTPPAPAAIPALPLPPTLSANVTLLDPASRQLLAFKLQHPTRPIGVLTTRSGQPVDVRETVSLNTDVFNSAYFYDSQTSLDQERIPERIVHAKGAGAFGYFEVTNDVSKYTKADVFNDIGKRTPLAVRFSIVIQNLGGNDLTRETRAMALKFYTNEGNLDLISLSLPVYLYRDPILFSTVSHSFHRNPKSNLYDATMRVDLLNLVPEAAHHVLRLLSDYGQTNGYRKSDGFPIHTYEVTNKQGESFFVKFTFKSEQGTEYLTEESARILGALDADYSTRDLYNAIASGNFPAWRLDMDVMTKEDLKKVNFNPFDVTRTWDNGTYHTVTIGRVVLNRNTDNWFKAVEQAAYNPGNLVPGIPGPPDEMFKVRRMAYQDTQNYRLGKNHNNIDVNRPNYNKVYNRDGVPPVKDNMRDAPNYYQNSFNGPVPYVDAFKARERLMIYDRNAVDLQPMNDFYNKELSDAGKTRLAVITAGILVNAVPTVREQVARYLTQIDADLGRRVRIALATAQAAQTIPQTFVPIDNFPRVVEVVPNPIPT